MATEAISGGSREATPGVGFVVRARQAIEQRQDDSGETENVGGFVVTERRQENDASPSRTATRLDDAATVAVEQPLPRSRRCSVCGEPGHTARTCQAIGSSGITTRATKAPDKDAVGAIAPMIVGTANFCVVTTFGAECGLTDLEGKLLIPSVQRTLARMPAAAAQKAAIVIDPLVILTVIIMWGRRIASIKDMEARAKYQINPTEQARANGVTGFTHSVESTEQQTTPPTVVNFDAARQRQAAEQLMPTPERVVANGAASNGTYGAPSHIRESIGSDAEF